MNVIKVLWWRIQQCLRTFAVLFVEVSSETGLFRHWSNNVLRVRNFGNTKAVRVMFFFSKYSKFNLNLKNAAKYSEKSFFFRDNCIWIGILKFSLLRTRYFSSVANVLTNSPKIWHVNKRNFFEYNCHSSDYWSW